MAKYVAIHCVLLTSGMLTGCYCPTLSGRQGESGCFPPCPPAFCGCAQQGGCPAAGTAASDSTCLHEPRHFFAGGRGLPGSGPVPSNQGSDYSNPLPKFHPIPTRPAFEPLATFALPIQLEGPQPPQGSPHSVRYHR